MALLDWVSHVSARHFFAIKVHGIFHPSQKTGKKMMGKNSLIQHRKS